jgi:hypothetical protein
MAPIRAFLLVRRTAFFSVILNVVTNLTLKSVKIMRLKMFVTYY